MSEFHAYEPQSQGTGYQTSHGEACSVELRPSAAGAAVTDSTEGPPRAQWISGRTSGGDQPIYLAKFSYGRARSYLRRRWRAERPSVVLRSPARAGQHPSSS